MYTRRLCEDHTMVTNISGNIDLRLNHKSVQSQAGTRLPLLNSLPTHKITYIQLCKYLDENPTNIKNIFN